MLCIVQARLSSERLPGKMLMDLRGRPLLGRVLDRLSGSRCLRRIVVATSVLESDDPIVAFCAREGAACFRGPLDDVAERFRGIVHQESSPAFVRISGDSPLIDPAIVDRAVGYFSSHADCDLVTNVFLRTFPKGQSVEVVRTQSFLELFRAPRDREQQEHVTRAFYQAPERHRIVSFTSGAQAGTDNLSVDTPTDLARVQRVLDRCENRPGSWSELLSLLRQVG
jgi:spore coat polysaccharide biosynthesis protein SpsF